MLRWTLSTLLADRKHVLASIGAVAGAFALALFFEAVFAGESTQIVAYLRHSDADVWVMQDGVSNMHMATSFVLDWKTDAVRRVPGVRRVTPMLYLNTVMQAGGGHWFSFIVGLQDGDTRAGPWSVSEGRATPGPGEIVVPDTLGRLAGLRLGDEARVADRAFTVAGFSEGTFSMANSVAFVPMSDLADIMSTFGTVSYLLVDAEDGVDATDLAARIEAEVDKVTALPAAQFVENDWQVAMQMGLEIVSLMIVIGGSLAMLLTAFTIYVSVSRRERELAVMKALGFRNRTIRASVLLQAMIVAAGGFVAAIGIVAAAVPVTRTLLPQVTLTIMPDAMARIGVIALVVALASAMLSVHKLTRVDPLSAFRN